jgi:predicted alpha/beta superfamily hydrolase
MTAATSDLPASPPGYRIEPVRRVRGSGFEWEHEVRVAVPEDHDCVKVSYPVLWMTDGTPFFELALEVLESASSPMILVSVATPEEERADFHRRRFYEFTPTANDAIGGPGADLWTREFAALNAALDAEGIHAADRMGGADDFLSLCVDAIRPTLARDYRMSGHHTLAGRSLGGLFCVYALFVRPGAFARYIATSPSLNCCGGAVFALDERHARSGPAPEGKLFLAAAEGEIAVGGATSAQGVLSSMARMAEILGLRTYPSLDLAARIYPGGDHGSAARRGLVEGLGIRS